jgi:hypothetical protein
VVVSRCIAVTHGQLLLLQDLALLLLLLLTEG